MIANRIFETRLYNYYLSAADMQEMDIRRHKETRASSSQTAILRPIINETGNYYIPNLPKLLYIGFKLVPQIPYKIGV